LSTSKAGGAQTVYQAQEDSLLHPRIGIIP
jgi:hypothetical protein